MSAPSTSASWSADPTGSAAGRTLPAVLVAGGTGALGTAVIRTLLCVGYPVTATWRSQRERDAVERELSDLGQLTLAQAELTDRPRSTPWLARWSAWA
jgi:nucleoside-diphosphate-sugar epimerase